MISASDIEESAKNWSDQFDPSHPSYHKGDKRVVDTSVNKKIPKGMGGGAAGKDPDWMKLPIVESAEKKADLNTSDGMLSHIRQEIGFLKKSITSLSAPVQKYITNPSHTKDALEARDNQLSQLDVHLEFIKSNIIKFNELDASKFVDTDNIVKVCTDVIDQTKDMVISYTLPKDNESPSPPDPLKTCSVVTLSPDVNTHARSSNGSDDAKEWYAGFMFKLNYETRQLFNLQAVLLKDIKTLKNANNPYSRGSSVSRTNSVGYESNNTAESAAA